MKPIRVVVPWWFGQRAMTLWPFVILKSNARDDECTWEHEMVHWEDQKKWGRATSYLFPVGLAAWFAVYLILKPFYVGRRARQHPMERGAYRISDECYQR